MELIEKEETIINEINKRKKKGKGRKKTIT
jgi:hypothetical protein